MRTDRHSADEVYQMGIDDLRALGEYLGDKEWFGGMQPSILDVCATSFLANLIPVPIDCTINDYARGNPKLVGYLDRAMKRIFVQ